jgi:hypothetical protein
MKRTYLNTSLLWSFVDVIAAIVIADILGRKRKMAKKSIGQAHGKSSAGIDGQINIGSLLDSRGGVAAIYLFNPYTIASCLARSTTSLNSLVVLAAIDSAMAGEPCIVIEKDNLAHTSMLLYSLTLISRHYTISFDPLLTIPGPSYTLPRSPVF